MKYTVSKLIFLWGLLLLFAGRGMAQERFVQFTYYDQVRWSPDGKRLAFRCILLDEGRPEIVKANLLLKDLLADQLLCLNPQPERFKISQDRKYLLFASAYGLYLLSLEKNGQPMLVYFREPTADWYWQDFGFYRDSKAIYIQREDDAGAPVQENYRLKLPDMNRADIGWLKMKKISRRPHSPQFNLPMDELNQRTSLRMKNIIFQFETGTEPGEYRFVLKSVTQPSSPTALIKACRPRLLSANPDSSEVIVSVLEGGRHHTYRYSLGASKLVPLAEVRYLAISWLDTRHYICLSDSGLFWRSIDGTLSRRLDAASVPEWCQSIELELPQFEIQVGFEKDKNRAEELVERLRTEGYSARLKYVKDLSQQGYRVRISGFKTRDEAQQVGRQLKTKGYGFWVDALTDWFDYLNTTWPDERETFDQQTAVIAYRLDRYLRSRIEVIDARGKRRILVDEMNNIPDRTKW